MPLIEDFAHDLKNCSLEIKEEAAKLNTTVILVFVCIVLSEFKCDLVTFSAVKCLAWTRFPGQG